MENEVMKKKSHKGLIVVVIILILVVLGLVGYICYDRGLILQKQENVSSDNKEDSNKVTNLELEEIREIVQELSNNFAVYYPISDLSKIDNQDLLNFALKKIGFSEEIKKSEIDNEIKKYFGNSIKVKHEDIECPLEEDEQKLYLYEDEVYKMNENHGGHGGGGFISAAPFYVSSEKDGNIINVNYKILYSNFCGDTCILNAYYRSYNDSINSENPVLEGDATSDDPGVNLTEELYKSVEVQIPVTSFKFEKTKDNTYNLKSISINK